jgi:hypothetical protein
MAANIDMLQRFGAVTRFCSLASGYVLGTLQALKITDFVVARLSIKEDSKFLTPAIWNTTVIATLCFTAEVLTLRELGKIRAKTPQEQPETHQGLISIGMVGLTASFFSEVIGQTVGASAYAISRGISLLCAVPNLILAGSDSAVVKEKGYQASGLYKEVRGLLSQTPAVAKTK